MDLGQQQHIHQPRPYRTDGNNDMSMNPRTTQNNLLSLSSNIDQMNPEDLNCLMPDVMFQTSHHHHQHHHNQNSHPYNQHTVTLVPQTPVPMNNTPDIQNIINSRKRRLSQHQQPDFNCISILGGDQSNVGAIKRPTSVAPVIKPEPGKVNKLYLTLPFILQIL